MDPLLIICTLLSFTFEYSRRVWRTYHPRTEPARDLRSMLPRRVSTWIEKVDWERDLGLRYDPWVPPQTKAVEERPAAAEIVEETKELSAPEEVLSDLELTLRLESEIVRAAMQTLFDELGLHEITEGSEEELIPMEEVVMVSSRFAAFDAVAGQPVGAPSVHEEIPRVISRVSQIKKISITVAARLAEPVFILPNFKIPSEERFSKRQLSAGPVGAPDVFDIVVPRVTDPLTMVQEKPVPVPLPPVAEDQGPIGAPGIFGFTPPAPDPTENIMAVEFARAGEAYRIAASSRKSGDYSIAAYTLNSADDKGPSRDAASGEEKDPAPDPVDELIAELLEEEPAVEDPNTLELPLQISGSPQLLAHCEPVGGPDVFECAPPAQAPAEVDAGDIADEPSAPTTREVNRLSERVETILSNALARPAPAVNFGDVLAQMAERQKERKKKKEEAANRLPSQALDDNIARSADREGGLKMTEYKVQFEIFEGPLDLLLYLVRKQEVDIYEVNLTQIAEEFIKYIELMRRFDLEVAGEFLVMASTLMYIKSKELLPVEQQSQIEEEEEDDDPRWELIRQLVEYKKFKDAAADFRQLELAQEDVFPRNPPKPDFPVQKLKGKVSVFDLLGAVNRILERIDAREEREIFGERWTVSEKIELIHKEINERERVKFSELFEDALSRSEVVATFLALLELIKLKVIVVEQPSSYADIDICKAPPGHKLNLDEEEELPLEEAAGLPASEFDAPAGEQD